MSNPDALLDLGAIQKRIDTRAQNPYRIKEGAFHFPADASEKVFKGILRDRVELFISSMARKGWDLKSRIRLFGPFPAYSEDGIPKLDQKEYRVRGVFKHRDSLEVNRLEIDPRLVKQAEDHTAPISEDQSIKDALKVMPTLASTVRQEEARTQSERVG